MLVTGFSAVGIRYKSSTVQWYIVPSLSVTVLFRNQKLHLQHKVALEVAGSRALSKRN